MFEQVKALICQYVDIDPATITEDTNIRSELGLNSLELINIAVAIEDEFDGVDLFESTNFDYEIYKSGIEYTQEDYELIKLKCDAYRQKKREINKKKFVECEDEEESVSDQIMKLNADLEENCFSICPNEHVLCEILLDVCYRDGFDTSIVWNLCGHVIVNKLISKFGILNYPIKDDCGDFYCSGVRFSMRSVVTGGENDD